ncbi:hypothetical protein CC86DRAFT_428357 [Ophiobolus disseminans]|uniref:Uncharacterized protein n=1 Tax=Ophiobolus disseminans TaxID=1469910 RepID=A0A6A6ZHI9_9PLEO|nr:hypothetical protein CC86DRAFT_428357 [Ophiobolus disseminans]
MIGELHVCAEAQVKKTSHERETTKVGEAVAQIGQKFASEAAEETNEAAREGREAARHGDCQMDVPTPWETCIQGAITCFVQAVLSIVGQMVLVMLAASNPMMGSNMAFNIVAKQGAGATNGTGATQQQQQAFVADPSYAAADLLRDLVTHFYQYLRGDSGPVDWTKFDEKKEPNAPDTPAGISYFHRNLSGQKSRIDVSNTDANKRLLSAIDTLIRIANELRDFIKTQDNLSAPALSPDTLAASKRDAKKAKEDTLQLAAAPALSPTCLRVRIMFFNVAEPQADAQYTETAAVNSALQQVQIAQTAVNAAQDNYDTAATKQAKTPAAMAEVERRLKQLQDSGKTLDEIKAILRKSICVLVNLSIQVGNIKQFFNMLSTVIDEVLMPRADSFNKEMDKVGRCATRNGSIQVDEMAKQTIYTATLQLKA